MRRLLLLALGVLIVAGRARAVDGPRVLAKGLHNPVSVAVGMEGRVYVTTLGEPGKDGDGSVLRLENGQATPFAVGLDDPRGLAAHQEWLFVADKQRLWRISKTGKAEVFVAASGFPVPPVNLIDVAVDIENGMLYVSDAGDGKGTGAAIYRVNPRGKAEVLTDSKRWPALRSPAGLSLDGASYLLVADAATGTLYRLHLGNRTAVPIAEGITGGLAWDYFGRLYGVDGRTGRLLVIPRPEQKPIALAGKFEVAGDPCLDPSWKAILVPDTKAGTVTAVSAQVPGAEVDQTPLPLETAVAFAKLQWTGWQPEDDRGLSVPLRPIVLTHAGDGSNRVFVATEHGVIHVFPNDQNAAKTKVFLDLRDRVVYNDKQNEEGFLGLAFHPQYKSNGELFVFYTTKKAKLTNVVSRFRVSKDNPDRADPASEEEILRFTKPFWNHDGGTICFGRDGFLYVTHGDGGLANDPYDNGQNLKTLLGKVLRLDVSRKEGDKNYAIPPDNPFLDKPGARPEIWAYGLRNIWRMAFDRKSGQLWAADVGQNLYEEIDLITRGGNYGWNRREGVHPFGSKGVGAREDLIEPIWEYHHNVGKSITGGSVYRGKRLPELEGSYLYADYVSGKIWALRYDESKQRVVANRPIRDRSAPIMSFGEDEQGEVYCMTYTPSGQGIFRFVRIGATR